MLKYFVCSEENAKKVGKLGAVSLMLKMLSASCLEDQDKTQIILTLAHAADICGKTELYIGSREYLMIIER